MEAPQYIIRLSARRFVKKEKEKKLLL